MEEINNTPPPLQTSYKNLTHSLDDWIFFGTTHEWVTKHPKTSNINVNKKCLLHSPYVAYISGIHKLYTRISQGGRGTKIHVYLSYRGAI